MQVRDLSMKSRLNNSLYMSVDDQKPSYDSLIHKSDINELEEIKAEDLYEENEINDLKGHIIYNDSEKIMRKIVKKMMTISLLFFKNQKYHKKILKKYDKQTLMQM